jgi:hypothetical protein
MKAILEGIKQLLADPDKWEITAGPSDEGWEKTGFTNPTLIRHSLAQRESTPREWDFLIHIEFEGQRIHQATGEWVDDPDSIREDSIILVDDVTDREAHKAMLKRGGFTRNPRSYFLLADPNSIDMLIAKIRIIDEGRQVYNEDWLEIDRRVKRTDRNSNRR